MAELSDISEISQIVDGDQLLFRDNQKSAFFDLQILVLIEWSKLQSGL